MSPVRPGWIGPTEWGSLSAEEKVTVAAMDPAAFSEWKAAREQGQAAEWRQRETNAGGSLRPKQRFNRLAVFAFVVSLLGATVIFSPILGPSAIILGIVALNKITDKERGRGLAKWAIALGVLNTVLAIVIIVT